MIERSYDRMKHIDMYIFIHFNQKISPIFTDQTLALMLSGYSLQYAVAPNDIDNIRKNNNHPSTTQLVKRLSDMGFAPRFIVELLNINHSSVSYHVHRPDPKEYISTEFSLFLKPPTTYYEY